MVPLWVLCFFHKNNYYPLESREHIWAWEHIALRRLSGREVEPAVCSDIMNLIRTSSFPIDCKHFFCQECVEYLQKQSIMFKFQIVQKWHQNRSRSLIRWDMSLLSFLTSSLLGVWFQSEELTEFTIVVYICHIYGATIGTLVVCTFENTIVVSKTCDERRENLKSR